MAIVPSDEIREAVALPLDPRQAVHVRHDDLTALVAEVERLQAEVSDLRFLIDWAVSKHVYSQWRGHALRVTGTLYRRLRAAADNGSSQEDKNADS